jgi:hypothetical protein
MSEIKRPVFFSGENPGMTLYVPGMEQAVAVASYWHCTDSPWGVGDALVLWLDTEIAPSTDVGQGYVFTDNLELAHVLVKNLTQYFGEFREVPVKTLEYADARCEHSYDGIRYRVICQTAQTKIEVQWTDVLDRKQVIWPQFPAGKAAYDLTTVICPCRAGRIQINDILLPGEVKTAAEPPSSTAFLAFAETWIGPLDRKEAGE